MTAAGAIFTQLQIRETHNKAKGRRFTMEEKLLSLSLYKQSKKSYRLLSKLFTLPSRKTLSSLLSKIPIKTGLDETFLKVLGENVKHLKKKDKFCVILFDEVSLEAQLHYDHNVGNIMGFEDNGLGRTQNFADHSLVFMIKGITKKYKQPMSYTFCQSSTNKHDLANQIRKVIQAVTSVGLKVVATICDQGTSNSAAIRVLHNYTKEYYLRRNENNYDDNFYEIQCGDERVKVIHLYDPPHLIKGIRNNLLNKNLVCTINGERKEARWQDIIDLYELDNNIQEVRMLPRLTREHVIPNEIRKMKVKNACQVLSQRVAAILNFLASRDIMDVKAKDTADICLFFDQIFDSVNGNFHKVVDGKVYRTAVTKNSPHHQLWRNAIKVMETMHFVDSVTKQKCKSQPPTIKNWILTLKGFQNVVKVMNANGVHSLLLRNFNQDPLENMFGALRALGYRNNNPNCQMFASSYRTLVLNNFLSSHSPGSNCEDDQGNSGLMSFQTLFDAYSKEMLEAEVTEPLQDRVADGKLRKKPQTEITHAQLEHQTNTYIAGYICKKLNTVFIKDCSKCLKEICTSTPTEQHDLVKNRDYQLNGKLNLKYPNTTFCQLVQNTIDIIYKHLQSICHHSSLKCELVKIINTTIDTNIVSCTTHKSEFGKRFVEFAIKLFVHNWCTHINRILAGKMYINSKESDQIKILASARYKKILQKASI